MRKHTGINKVKRKVWEVSGDLPSESCRNRWEHGILMGKMDGHEPGLIHSLLQNEIKSGDQKTEIDCLKTMGIIALPIHWVKESSDLQQRLLESIYGNNLSNTTTVLLGPFIWVIILRLKVNNQSL